MSLGEVTSWLRSVSLEGQGTESEGERGEIEKEWGKE